MSNKALPEHHRETLVKYATRLYDAAARAYRKYSYENFDVALRGAAEMLRYTKRLGPAPSRDESVWAARHLNMHAETLSKALVGQGQPEFSFLKP